MTTLKARDIKRMSKEEKEKKLEEMRMELVKSKVNASKTGAAKIKKIKKVIARILTLNK